MGATAVDRCATDVVFFGLFETGEIMGANQFTVHSISHLAIQNVCGVYRLVDTVNGYTYVGSSKNIRMRAMQHLSAIATGLADAAYVNFRKTFIEHGYTVFQIDILEVCGARQLRAREKLWIAQLSPSENSFVCADGRKVFSDEERVKRAARVSALWKDPVYRARAVAARVGKAYNKGYICAPEQVQNRKKAGRISNMKRNYGDEWQQEYVRRYPEFAGDING